MGRALTARLQAAGLAARVLTRDAARARSTSAPSGVQWHGVDVHDPAALAAALAGCDAVVNLIGILNERRDDGRDFWRAHVETTSAALAAAVTAGVPRFVQVSALNAAVDGPSHYLRTKGEAERRVLAAAALRTAIVRPSVIFGAGDGLFGRFLPLVKFLPCLPLAGAHALLQPVFVGDVAAAILRILQDDTLPRGSIFELGGPERLTLRQIVDYTARHAGRRCPVLALPAWAGRLQAEVCEHLPGKPFSRDNWRSLAVASVVRGADGLATLGIPATPLGDIVPALLKSRRHGT